MYLYFLKDYYRGDILIFKKDETNFVKDDVLARYLIRQRYAVESRY
jgi:hypothetical protein